VLGLERVVLDPLGGLTRLGAGSVPATEPVTVNERGGLNDPDTRSFGVAPSAVVYTCQKYVPLARPLTFACVGAVDWSEPRIAFPASTTELKVELVPTSHQ
jgi:hypothetical protein